MLNLLVTVNSNYVKPLCVMLRSITKSNPYEKFSLYIAYSSLERKDLEEIENVVSGYDFVIKPIKLDSTLFDGAPTEKRISKETYYRLFAPLYLPKELDRILYIDPDTVVINSLAKFYSTPFGGNAVIGAKHFAGVINRLNRNRLFMKRSKYYINAGVMLMNLTDMRKTFDTEKIFSVISRKIPILYLADQDVINILYDGKIGYESEYVINFDENCYKKLPKDSAMEIVKASAVIVHFSGKHKPWQPNYKGYLDALWHEYC